MIRSLFASVLLLPIFFGAAGCSVEIGGVDVPSPEFDKNAPVVFIYPLAELDRQYLSLGILSFQVPPNVDPLQGEAVAGLFRDVILGKQTFNSVKLIEQEFASNAEAASIGKKNGVDLVLAGRINYILNGYELGGDRVDVSVRLLDVKSGSTVWYLQQTVDKAVAYPDKSFSNRLTAALSGGPPVRPPVDAPAVANMLLRIAEDMSSVVAGDKTVSRN